MKIDIGDMVETIDDAISGIVIAVNDSIVTIEADEGFRFQFDASELIVINNLDSMQIGSLVNQDMVDIKLQKAEQKQSKKRYAKAKDRHRPTFVVDLHIHQLTDSTKGMTNFDMLNLQLDSARKQLEFAIRKRMPKMVFIHGVGEGVLREELYTLLRRYNNVNFYDADYKTYGLGATEVRIFQNVEA